MKIWIELHCESLEIVADRSAFRCLSDKNESPGTMTWYSPSKTAGKLLRRALQNSWKVRDGFVICPNCIKGLDAHHATARPHSQ